MSVEVPENEPIEERYRRDWLELRDDRKVRGYDLRSAERRSRDYVDPATVAVSSEGVVTGTVGAAGDNVDGSGNTLNLPDSDPEIDQDNDNSVPPSEV